MVGRRARTTSPRELPETTYADPLSPGSFSRHKGRSFCLAATRRVPALTTCRSSPRVSVGSEHRNRPAPPPKSAVARSASHSAIALESSVEAPCSFVPMRTGGSTLRFARHVTVHGSIASSASEYRSFGKPSPRWCAVTFTRV